MMRSALMGNHAHHGCTLAPVATPLDRRRVKGEGGIRAIPGNYLEVIVQICDEHGILMMTDCVQSGTQVDEGVALLSTTFASLANL